MAAELTGFHIVLGLAKSGVTIFMGPLVNGLN